MRNFNGSYVYESCDPGGRRSKMKNRSLSPECKCSPPIVNVHHYQCPLMKTPCPLHGYPFVYSFKSKKTPPDEYLVISFQPSLKTDKLFEPIKKFLTQTCEPDTKVNFQYYSPRLSEANCEDFKDRQVQTNPEDFKKLANCFAEKKKTFLSDKTNKMKKLKQCFNSPCSSVVHKSRSCTAIKEKIDRTFGEGTGDGYSDKSKLKKRLKSGCCMKSEESSHFLYKRDFDLSDGEKSSKEKIDSDIVTKINNNIFEIISRKGFNERVSAKMKPQFMYSSFVSPDPITDKVQGQTQTEEASNLEKTHEGSPDSNELKENKEGHNRDSPEGSHTENVPSDSSGSVYFTPFIFVPAGNDKEVEDKALQTIKREPKMSDQWVQTMTEHFRASVSKDDPDRDPGILVAETKNTRTLATQTSGIFMPEACICRGPQTIYDARTEEKSVETAQPVTVGNQTDGNLTTTSVVYYEPEMKFLKREEQPENTEKNLPKSVVETQPEEKPLLSTFVYYEPEMKFLKREESPADGYKNLPKSMKSESVGTQTDEKPIMSTVVYYEPEMKFLRKKTPEKEEEVVKVVETRSIGVQTEEAIDEKVSGSKAVEVQVTASLSTFFPSNHKTKSPQVRSEEIPTIIYFEPEMKLLTRTKSSESVGDVKKLKSVGVQTPSEPVTVIYFEPEMKPLRRKDDSGKRGVVFNEKTQINEIERGTKDKSLATEPESLEDSDRERYYPVYLPMSQNKETQTVSDSNSSLSYFDGSDTSNVTYVVKSYVSEETEQVVVKNWNKSRSDGDMLEKKKCQCAEPNPNGLTFVGVYHKKETYANSNPQDSTKAQLSKPEAIAKRNEDNKASFADLSDLILIINENFKKIIDRRIGMCECQQAKEKKPTADKEVMTDISGADDIEVIFKKATKSMANPQIQADLPHSEEMVSTQPNNPDQMPPICKMCSKVMSMKTISVGTSTPDGSFFQTKREEVDMRSYCEDFPVVSGQEAPGLKPKPTEILSTSKGIKSVRMSTKTFVTKFEKPLESKPSESKAPVSQNKTPSPTPRKTLNYPEPFSDSTNSLRRGLRRAQNELGVKPKSSPRPTPSPRSRPTPAPTPRQKQSPQSRPQVYTRVIPDAYCGNIIATTTTRQIPSGPIQQKCLFRPPSTECVDDSSVCPLQPGPSNPRCDPPKKDPDSKQNFTTYPMTISPVWSKDIMNMFESKLKKISKSEFAEPVSNSIGKHKRNHDGGCDGGTIGKKIRSAERDKTDTFDTNPSDPDGCLELGKSLTDILVKFLKEENEMSLNESPRLTKDTGFVWVPSFPTPQFFSIKKVSSAEETPKSIELPKQVSRSHSHVLSKVPKEKNCPSSPNENTCRQDPGGKTLIKKLFKCSSCKSVTYLQLKHIEITENPKNDSKSNFEDCFRSLVFTPTSHNLAVTPTLDRISENSFPADEQMSLIDSQQSLDTVPSAKIDAPSSGSDEAQKLLDYLNSKFPSVKSDSNSEIDSNEVEIYNDSQPAYSNPRTNEFSFRGSSADVSNSKKTTKSKGTGTYRFSADSSTAISGTKKKILKKLPLKIFQGSSREPK